MITKCLNVSFQISPSWVLDIPAFSMYIKYPAKLPTAQIENLASQLSDCFKRGSDKIPSKTWRAHSGCSKA